MAHDARCSGSVLTPVRDCDCQCDKALHGVPHSDRGSAFFAPAEGRVERAGRVSTKFRTRLNADPDADRWSERASDYIGAKLTEEAIVVGFEPAGVLNAISETALDALFDAVRDGTVTSSEASASTPCFNRVTSSVRSAWRSSKLSRSWPRAGICSETRPSSECST
jgi:hypothetical protein